MVDDIQIIITRETDAVTQAGFGVPLIVDTSKGQSVDYEIFTSLSAVVDETDWSESDEGYKIAAAIFAQEPTVEKVAMVGLDYDPESAEEDNIENNLIGPLNELLNEGKDDFYFIVADIQAEPEQTALSGWATATQRLYFTSTDDKDLADNLDSERTVVMVHKDADEEYPAEAWVGKCAPLDPGSITWKFKNLEGISLPGYTDNEISQIHDNNGNTYVRKLGIAQTSEGKATDGTFIDIVRSQDFIKARMTEALGQLLFNAPKIPYDITGISQVVATIDGVLKRAANQGIIARDEDGNALFGVLPPSRDDISEADIANRILPDVKFEFVLAGAIHEIKVVGVIRL